MKDSSEESSVEIVNSDDEIVVAVGRVEAEVTAPSEDFIIKTIRAVAELGPGLPGPGPGHQRDSLIIDIRVYRKGIGNQAPPQEMRFACTVIILIAHNWVTYSGHGVQV